MTCYSRIYSQQQNSYNNQYLTIYSRELRIGYEKKREVTEFVERIRKVQEEVGIVLKRAQEEMKQQVDKE